MFRHVFVGHVGVGHIGCAHIVSVGGFVGGLDGEVQGGTQSHLEGASHAQRGTDYQLHGHTHLVYTLTLTPVIEFGLHRGRIEGSGQHEVRCLVAHVIVGFAVQVAHLHSNAYSQMVVEHGLILYFGQSAPSQFEFSVDGFILQHVHSAAQIHLQVADVVCHLCRGGQTSHQQHYCYDSFFHRFSFFIVVRPPCGLAYFVCLYVLFLTGYIFMALAATPSTLIMYCP